MSNWVSAIYICTYLQFEFEKRSGGGRAVDRSASPGGGQAHCVVTVHMRQEEQTYVAAFPHLPEVYSQGCVRDNLPVHLHGKTRSLLPLKQ